MRLTVLTRCSVGVALTLAVWLAAGTALADWEAWSGTSVRGAIDESTSFRCSTSFRRNEGLESLYFSMVELGLDRKLGSHVAVGVYYSHVNQRRGDVWLVEYRPHLNVTVAAGLGPFRASDRNRLELRTIEAESSVRYRNRLSLFLVRFDSTPVRPYVAVEPFYDFDADELNKNRAYVGTGLSLPGGLGADLYYMYESRKKDGAWKGVPVAGATLSYTF